MLSLIEKHSDYRFLYTDDPVFENSRVTIKVQKAAFEEVMNRILAGTGLGYTVNNNELVVLSFTLSRGGTVLGRSIARSSGNAELDQEVLAMVLRAQPFPPFPAGMNQGRIGLSVPVRFSLH